MSVYKKIKAIVLDFSWKGKPSKIAYDTIIGKVEEGGLGLIDPLIRMKNIRIKTVNKYWKEEKHVERCDEIFLNKCGEIQE